MSLRTKFLALFISLGALPLLALGVMNFGQSTRALEDLLEARTRAIASRAGDALSHSYARALADLLFLAKNAETQRVLRASSGSDGSLQGSDHSEAVSFLDTAWQTVGSYWAWAEIRDAGGDLVHRMGEQPTGAQIFEGARPLGGNAYIETRSILKDGGETGEAIGTLRASLSMQSVLPRTELATGFGEFGYSAVIDREGGRLLFHPHLGTRRQSLSALLGPDGWDVDAELLDLPTGRFTYADEGTRRIASFVSLDDPAWTVISSESLDEFAAPFARLGSLSLLIVLLVTVTISAAFILLTRQATDSLRHLTEAADEVAGGNLDPSLPPGGRDEVGRLSSAFSIMVDQIRSMLHRVEESRHMSAIGEFAAQLSHEIRNPLTSIKLNLQRLDRGVKDGRIPDEYVKAVRLSLREAKRLDGTVRGVLSLSRTRAPRREPVSLHEVIRSALDALSPQMDDEGLTVQTAFFARECTVMGDRELLEGAFLNLFLNSVEVMDRGGVLRVATESAGGGGKSALGSDPGATYREILTRISDDGPGVPEEVRDRIFDPFFTTKGGGAGFGLSLATRVMEEHSGTLVLDEPDPSKPGATFLAMLPIAHVEEMP